MFIINGNKGESIILDNHILVKIVENSDGQLVLEIDSAKKIKIVKGEK